MVPSGWNVWNATDLIRSGVLEIGDGYRAKNSEMAEGGLPFARAGNVNSGFNFEDADILCAESVRRAGPKVSKPFDVTFTSKGTFGRFAFVTKSTPPFVYSPQLCYWRVKKRSVLDSRFLFFWMQGDACLNQMRGLKGLTDMADYVSLANQRKMWVSAPPLPTQRKIASILSAYDDLIENNTRRIAILEEMARSLYREWFVHFRFPGHEKVKMVDSPLGKIPAGWEVRTIDDLCECVTDGSHFSPPSVEQGMPMASSKDMHNWGLDLAGARRISRENYDILVKNGCKPRKNDVLITKDGANYLKHIFVLREGLDVVLLSSIAILRSNARINPHLLAAALNAPANKERLRNYVTGAAIPRIVLKDFKRFQIPVPTDKTQRDWVKIAQPIIESSWSLIDRSETLRATRDLLLPKLISGEIDVSDLDIEVPEVGEVEAGG
jgi:type I restriction enzyme, S subunit